MNDVDDKSLLYSTFGRTLCNVSYNYYLEMTYLSNLSDVMEFPPGDFGVLTPVGIGVIIPLGVSAAVSKNLVLKPCGGILVRLGMAATSSWALTYCGGTVISVDFCRGQNVVGVGGGPSLVTETDAAAGRHGGLVGMCDMSTHPWFKMFEIFHLPLLSILSPQIIPTRDEFSNCSPQQVWHSFQL